MRERWNDFQILLENRIYDHHSAHYFKSIKSVSTWFIDFDMKIQYLLENIEKGVPNCIDISLLMNPTAFFTNVKEIYARKNSVPVEKVSF